MANKMQIKWISQIVNRLRRRRVWIYAILSITGLIVVVVCTYWLWNIPYFPNQTGFNNKTLWDVADLLLVPFALAVVAYLLSTRQKQAELEVAKAQRLNDQQIARDREEEVTLQSYFDRMANLMLQNGLRAKTQDTKVEEARSVARALTLTALRRLNSERKGILLKFLYESRLIGYVDDKDVRVSPIITLESADLTDVNLQGARLQGINLRGANLQRANLGWAHLYKAILQKMDLQEANLRHAYFTEADLSESNLQDARLDGAVLNNLVYSRQTNWPQGFVPPVLTEYY